MELFSETECFGNLREGVDYGWLWWVPRNMQSPNVTEKWGSVSLGIWNTFCLSLAERSLRDNCISRPNLPEELPQLRHFLHIRNFSKKKNSLERLVSLKSLSLTVSSSAFDRVNRLLDPAPKKTTQLLPFGCFRSVHVNKHTAHMSTEFLLADHSAQCRKDLSGVITSRTLLAQFRQLTRDVESRLLLVVLVVLLPSGIPVCVHEVIECRRRSFCWWLVSCKSGGGEEKTMQNPSDRSQTTPLRSRNTSWTQW